MMKNEKQPLSRLLFVLEKRGKNIQTKSAPKYAGGARGGKAHLESDDMPRAKRGERQRGLLLCKSNGMMKNEKQPLSRLLFVLNRRLDEKKLSSLAIITLKCVF